MNLKYNTTDWIKGRAFFIYLSTGCSCSDCQNEREIFGPIFDQDEALDKMASFARCCLKPSQYSETGIYSLYEFEGYIQDVITEEGEIEKRFMYGDYEDDICTIFNRPAYFPYETKISIYSGAFIISSN